MTDSAVELLPTKTTFARGHEVVVEVRNHRSSGTARLLHLGDEVASTPVDGERFLSFGLLPPGGYGVEFSGEGVIARTAVEVVADETTRCRYGFVADYRPSRDGASIADHARRLHLTDIQFYDWAYRHADLLGGGETYADPLGQPISLETVRSLIDALHEIGSRAIGYAAVYGVGEGEWPAWQHIALRAYSGQVWRLGDFLSLVDPADATWLSHFAAELRAAAEKLGFDGFHLDQYGYPKLAVRPDGKPVRVEDSFAAVIEAARDMLPSARLIFNNVNGFPLWRTAKSPQDVLYVEVWPPCTTLAHLADVARTADGLATGRPVVVAAYQHVYDEAPADAADLATAFTMATLFSHGANHLLCGETDRILVDPYYVRNHVAESSTSAMLRRWYDFLVEHVELLQHTDAVDVTGALAGDYNKDCDVSYEGAVVTDRPVPGTIWRRIVKVGDRLIVHLVNLVGQDDIEWDAPRKPVEMLGSGDLRARLGHRRPRVRFADPDGDPHLVDAAVRLAADEFVATLPPPRVWQIVVIDL